MKRILPEFEFSEEQLNNVRRLAKECNLCEETVKILYGRGVRDKNSITDFMHPSKSHFVSPFKMSGMQEAVELITKARDEEWVVVVYGDYDADGICASTVMGNALKDFGIEPIVFVPERNNGYGLSAKTIDDIFDEYFPQLFITVDCGISCAEEVEYLKELGAEVIVTDHHELPDKIPDCICINPKFNDGYPYDNLCGAGVAFKVGCALNGESAYKYLDFAAIATVADSVPLTGENRDIVYEGLKIIRDNPAKCYQMFLNKSDAITAQTLAFTLAPKINAAGRMGDAKAALALFNEKDENKIFDLAAKLTAYNIERQKCCDELYLSAKEMLKSQGFCGKIILLCNESWNSGFVGIVAARLADEFACPAILFVKNGNMLKGSARSVESVNIFEALKACQQFVTEFGGHSQAAGVNVTEDNFDNLAQALEEYISTHYLEEDFIPTVYINGKLSDDYSQKLVKEMEQLEPFGVGNRRPMFVAEEAALSVRPVKPLSSHLSIKNSKLELMYFGGGKYARLLSCAAPKQLIFEYNVSSFRGKEYIKGFVRDVIYGKNARTFAEDEMAFSLIETLSCADSPCKISNIDRSEVEKLMDGKPHGTVFISWDNSVLNSYANDNLNSDLFYPSSKNFQTAILVAPAYDVDLSGFNRVIFLDNIACASKYATLTDKRVEAVENAPSSKILKKLSVDRDGLLSVYAAVSANANNIDGATAEEVAKRNGLGDSLQVFFALKVFEQLSIVTFKNGRLEVMRGVKSKLENSPLYNKVKEIKEENRWTL
ncbi:MAG: single-stranded-DNA-specific exonuclease RecJ [Clostridia bacterium]|nr:single-stranded-DNA-specific exonuclease RecJ [Clostridia bacterium]